MIADILFNEDTIRARVTRLGEEISAEYEGKNPLVVGVLNSSAVFLADLTRAITIPCEYDFIAVSRYTEAEGIRFEKDTSTSVEGRHVLLVEDTIDTGLTLQYVIKTLSSRKPASLEVCALLNRDNRRIAEIQPRFCGFDIPDVYVVGYGLDYEGRYRELPALYAHGSWPK
ncbi:MAG: hypoxanthine phosphoribosyltransferase [Candidatus Eremiobacteraeota bacterium]|nr:hypoxanthine phosphoribosyltransferase [Candidatus Eremiobacteraeota bacterium]